MKIIKTVIKDDLTFNCLSSSIIIKPEYFNKYTCLSKNEYLAISSDLINMYKIDLVYSKIFCFNPLYNEFTILNNDEIVIIIKDLENRLTIDKHYYKTLNLLNMALYE